MLYLSLCIPTNGVSNWVLPALEAIYSQGVNDEEFEVIVTDNGDNEIFHHEIGDYIENHRNLKYKHTEAVMFQNQIEALRLGEGVFLKFLNHRSIMKPGSLTWMINYVKENQAEKPIIYFSNGGLRKQKVLTLDSFDGFVAELGHIASWTTGVGVWKSDFDAIPLTHSYNRISPHSDVLFRIRRDRKYIIDDTLWSKDVDSSQKNKGKYDLYKAFAVEEPCIALQLFLDGDITAHTLKRVVKSYKKCVAGFYLRFNIMKESCSYDIGGFDAAMGIFMSKTSVMLYAICLLPIQVLEKVYSIVWH